ncbi:Gfo/Idh/MocA family oxidoreductase [Herbiconiux moechotypicola]|uniref:Gfo/Idh/MocA family oxidoreductase n=1 Tax=Herbiconiux moechotypicola TaxID=637393 RepID=A0ABP5Q908_9MICO|nr:Gfo/Idh/MocA family oxidoreductase [Herbiconiux moechotypicola]MCS5729174.1 Gfo/Idh/MocA family oxidoreductase [Herbiconiux moechotypicola]
MRDLKFAVIGGGFMGKAHSIALASYPMYVWPTPLYPVRELIVEINDELAAESQKRFGYNRASTDWRAAVEDPEIDVVDILVPNVLHYDVVMAAVAAGKHVICEKPLALTSAKAREMADAADAAGVVNQVGFNWRLAPAVQLAKKLIDEGAIGEVRHVKAFWLGEFFNDPSTPLVWRFKKEQAGSGALGDLGSHAIDFARFLAGEITEVQGVQQQFVAKRQLLDGSGEGDVDVDDATSFLVNFASGASGYIECSWSAAGHKTGAGFEVIGSTGSLSFDWEHLSELRFYDGSDAADRQGFRTIYTGPPHPSGDWFWPIAGYQIGYADTKVIQLADFVHAVAGETERPQTTFREGLKSTLVEEAVMESAESREWTAVPAE